MKTPKLTLFFTTIATIALIALDFLTQSAAWLELIQDFVFVILGGFLGVVSFGLKDGNKKPVLIDSEKLALEVANDEKRQLEEKVKTLEAALDRLMK